MHSNSNNAIIWEMKDLKISEPSIMTLKKRVEENEISLTWLNLEKAYGDIIYNREAIMYYI